MKGDECQLFKLIGINIERMAICCTLSKIGEHNNDYDDKKQSIKSY